MKRMRVFAVAAVIISLGACVSSSPKSTDTSTGTSTGNSNDTSTTTQPATPTTITLLHFSDLHAHLTPHWDRVPDAPTGETAATSKIVQRGGLARLATLVKQQRAQYPNSILLNVGDTYHGGVEGLYTLGEAIAAPVNALGIDVGVPGNWDYAYGPIVTRMRYADLSPIELNILKMAAGVIQPTGTLSKPNFPNLAANVSYTLPPNKSGKPFLPPTWTTEKAGVKIGFIGLSSDIVPRMSATLARGLSFVDGESNYKTLVEQHARDLRTQGAAIVVVMSELGLHKNKRLADIIEPKLVDVIFSAHTHEPTFKPLAGSSGTLVVESGNDGNLGRMNITVAANQAPTFDWTLMPIGTSIPEDAAMKAIVDQARAPFLASNPNIKLPMPYVDITLSQSIATVVGATQGPLDRRHALENTFNRAYTDALKQHTGTTFAMAPGFRFDAVIAQQGYLLEDNTIADGTLTLEDVYRFFPMVYTISTAEVTGQHLKEIVESGLTSVYSKDAFKQSGGWVEGFAGLGLNVNVAGNDGARIANAWSLDDNQPIDDVKSYTITGCTRPDDASDELCSYSGFSNVRPVINSSTAAPWTQIDIFLDMLAKGNFGAPQAKRFTDTSNTPVWPQAPFVQPLWQ